MCERCHTARDERGNPDRAHWLMGGPVQWQVTYAAPDWAHREPSSRALLQERTKSLFGLLTAGISRTGRLPYPPMPPFRMTREDAEGVLVYFKSL